MIDESIAALVEQVSTLSIDNIVYDFLKSHNISNTPFSFDRAPLEAILSKEDVDILEAKRRNDYDSTISESFKKLEYELRTNTKYAIENLNTHIKKIKRQNEVTLSWFNNVIEKNKHSKGLFKIIKHDYTYRFNAEINLGYDSSKTILDTYFKDSEEKRFDIINIVIPYFGFKIVNINNPDYNIEIKDLTKYSRYRTTSLGYKMFCYIDGKELSYSNPTVLMSKINECENAKLARINAINAKENRTNIIVSKVKEKYPHAVEVKVEKDYYNKHSYNQRRRAEYEERSTIVAVFTNNIKATFDMDSKGNIYVTHIASDMNKTLLLDLIINNFSK